jgi:hypothetical protein
MTRRQIVGKAAARMLEEYAFALDLIRIPMLRKQQEKLIYKSYWLSNRIRKEVGLEQKRFKRLKERGIIEVIA